MGDAEMDKPTGYRVEYLCGGCNKAHAWGECTEEKELKNEPVAWRCKKFYETQEGWFYNENKIGEPLYTHPAKTLTDEEIEDFTVRIYNCRTGAEAHEIVLAILRKANEK
jgi:hypothetical protein